MEDYNLTDTQKINVNLIGLNNTIFSSVLMIGILMFSSLGILLGTLSLPSSMWQFSFFGIGFVIIFFIVIMFIDLILSRRNLEDG